MAAAKKAAAKKPEAKKPAAKKAAPNFFMNRVFLIGVLLLSLIGLSRGIVPLRCELDPQNKGFFHLRCHNAICIEFYQPTSALRTFFAFLKTLPLA